MREVTDRDFSEIVNQPGLVVVDFWASWCAPCLALAPTMENLDKEFQGKATFIKVDTQANPVSPSKLGIMGLPTVLFFQDGNLTDRSVGLVPAGVLREKINRLITI